ncbi:MAG: trehalose-6-phosphate synthase [Actinobacteria bacterium]|nr:trehalose-6-phosphate synthase [Actinomycetota bacterium]
MSDHRLDAPIVICSNRGPVSYHSVDGELEGVRGAGGLISGLLPLMESGRARWIAAALSEEDRVAAALGLPERFGPLHLLDINTEDLDLYYNVVSNEVLWFLHHGLLDSTYTPDYTDEWRTAWQAYRRVNTAFAEAVCNHGPHGATVLVQDYHLSLLAPLVAAERPDLRLVHFHHTPFAGPGEVRLLEPTARREILTSLAAHHACGFHIGRWETNFRRCIEDMHLPSTSTFTSTLSSDLGAIREVAASPACDAALAKLTERVGDRFVIGRVDRMELSKNIVRGFAAYERLLGLRPELVGRVVFVAQCYPSRVNVPAYRRYRDLVVDTVERINGRWGSAEWTPIELADVDDFPASVATYRRYDALLVNPVRDGLNLVAKEGPAVNERHGQVVLSSEAGASVELAGAADEVHPFDVVATSEALSAIIDRSPSERRARSEQLRRDIESRTPQDWLADQLHAAE